MVFTTSRIHTGGVSALSLRTFSFAEAAPRVEIGREFRPEKRILFRQVGGLHGVERRRTGKTRDVIHLGSRRRPMNCHPEEEAFEDSDVRINRSVFDQAPRTNRRTTARLPSVSLGRCSRSPLRLAQHDICYLLLRSPCTLCGGQPPRR